MIDVNLVERRHHEVHLDLNTTKETSSSYYLADPSSSYGLLSTQRPVERAPSQGPGRCRGNWPLQL